MRPLLTDAGQIGEHHAPTPSRRGRRMIPGMLAAVAVLVLGVAVAPDRCRAAVVAVSDRSPTRRPRPRRSRNPTPRPAVDGRSRRPRRLVRRASPVRSVAERRCNHALRSVAPPPTVDDQLAPAMLALERGASVAGAFADLQTRSPHLDLVVVVMRACAEHGGAAAEPIDRAASALRQRAALAGERRTQSAQARMSAIVMTLPPRRHARHAADHLRGPFAARRSHRSGSR